MPVFMTLETLDKAPAYRAAIYDYYAGTSDTVAHGTAGILFDNGSVVVQTYAADPFRLAIRLAGNWYELCPVRRDDPAMMELDEAGKIHRPGLSAGQQAAQDKHERLRREQQSLDDANARAQQERSQQLREAQEAEAERQRRDWIAMHE